MSSKKLDRSASVWCLALLALACSAGGPEAAAPEVASALGSPPAAEHSFAPYLTGGGGELLLTWIEPLGEGAHRVRFARWTEAGWGAPATVTEGADLFANWADTPGVVRGGDDALYAHWLAETGSEKYAYSILLARSVDHGATWEPLGPLPDDDTPTEHGFVSWVPEADGARAFWLDGRQWVEGGPMSLRTARVGSAGVSGAARLDARVCDCCPTAAAMGEGGPLVVYRDRSEDEIRDIYRMSWAGGGWGEPEPVAVDGWRIEGCPVNGPRVAARDGREAVAWFTAAGDEAAVRMVFAGPGATPSTERSTPLRVDDGRPLGRVDLELGEGGAWVIWLEALAERRERAEVRLRWVSDAGELSESRAVAETGSARASGFPHLARLGERLVLAWVESTTGSSPRVRVTDLGTR